MEPLPPALDDAWGRSVRRFEAWRDVWIRPGDRVERHPGIQLLEPSEAVLVVGRWAREDFAFLERVHRHASSCGALAICGLRSERDPDQHRAAIRAELVEAFRAGRLVVHVAQHAASGQGPVSPPPPPADPGPGKKPGTIPIPPANLLVHVRTPEGKVIAGATVHIGGPELHTAHSDGSGTARFSGITPGTYTIEGTRAGHVEGTTTATPTPGSTVSATVILTPISLEIIDENGVVLDAARTWIVGERVVVTARSKPAGQPLTAITWIVPGEIVAGQSYTSAAGTITPAPVSAFHQPTMRFHWIAGHATAQLQVRAAVRGVALAASVPVEVLAPTAVSLVATTRSVNVGLDKHARLSLCFWEQNPGSTDRDEGSPGIEWKGEFTPPHGGDGQIAHLQLINTKRSHMRPDGSMRALDSKGSFWLDDSSDPSHVFMGMSGLAIPPDSNEFFGGDAPSNPIELEDVESNASDAFKVYLMYRPDTAGSIWVTLARLSWSWGGRAVKKDGEWHLVASDHLKNPVGAPSSELPLWSEDYLTHRASDWDW